MGWCVRWMEGGEEVGGRWWGEGGKRREVVK